jgi:hypothetical protein
MNRVSDSTCCFHSKGQYHPMSEAHDSKVAGVAHESLESVATYHCLQRQSAAPGSLEQGLGAPPPMLDAPPTQSSNATRPNLFQTFESSYQTLNPGKTCPSMSCFTEDAPLLEELLTRWTLDSDICFFDLLGFDIYDHWKRVGADAQDLGRFCQYCNKLSVELLKSADSLINPQFLRAVQGGFKLLAARIPEELKPKFAFLLKALSEPQQVTVLGCSSVYAFEQNRVLDGDVSKREDVLAFLDFACAMHPNELKNIRGKLTDAALSRALSEVIRNLTIEQVPLDMPQLDLYNLLILLKKIVDQRLLQKKIPMQRLAENINNMESFESSKYKDWIKKMIHEHLSDAFDKNMSTLYQG